MRKMKRVSATAIAMALVVSGCSGHGELEWLEEVALVGGGSVAVKHKSVFRAPSELGQPPGESWYSLDFEHPATKAPVHVEVALRASTAEMVKAAQENQLLMQWPVALMVQGSDLYFVTWSHFAFHQELRCPDPPYQLYRWTKEGKWLSIPLTEIPHKQFNQSFFDAQNYRARALLKSRNYRLGAKDIAEYREISRAEYDISGMSKVTYQADRFCRNYREWHPSPHLTN